jgi:serine/threonine-protein kinase
VELSARRVIAEKYEVLGVLGRGGTGVVYDAITQDGTAIALKVMHDALAGDKQIRGRFEREAAILRRLEGAHICPILDSGEVAGPGTGTEAGKSLLYIALPKIVGESLADRLAKGPLEVDVALDIMREVLAALSSAHSQGVIHRDLKPANVLLQDGKHVVVVDFGMSKIVTGTGTGTTNLTTHNMVFGTPEYMSPEQARGDDLDIRCDIYAAGVLLYELLAGVPPFTGETPLNVLTAHLTSELPPPSARPSARGRVTPALEAVIIHALARDREQRYPSAEAFAAALAQARSNPTDGASVAPKALASSAPKADAFAPTLPKAVLGETDVDATAPTLLGDQARPVVGSSPPPRPKKTPSVRPSAQPRPTPSRPPPEPVSSRRMWLLAWIVVSVASIAAGVWFALNR